MGNRSENLRRKPQNVSELKGSKGTNHRYLRRYRGFIPDSGHLVHVQTPLITDTVRVDAGFIKGDEVSSHYDPMIAKLIVRGPCRTSTVQKLHSALEQYEIAGLATNIEFLKSICAHPSFVAAEVETGFINKHRDRLFIERPVAPEVYAQAALGLLFLETTSRQNNDIPSNIPHSGFAAMVPRRLWDFLPGNLLDPNEMAGTSVTIDDLANGCFDIVVSGTPAVYRSVTSSWDSETRQVTSFFPDSRLDTRVIDDGQGNLTLFQQGKQFCIRCATPTWAEKASGIKTTTHSVLAPMPCKILRVEVKASDRVKRDQVLVVIESMKMETVIRSPQHGVISRIVHQQGVGIVQSVHAAAKVNIGSL